MSFILDALKKAESERNRRVAPVLMDARVAMPRRGLPVWAWALGVILVVNLGLLAWLLLRDASPEDVAAIAPVPTAVPAAAGANASASGVGSRAGGAGASSAGASSAGAGVAGGGGAPGGGGAASGAGVAGSGDVAANATQDAPPVAGATPSGTTFADPAIRTVPGIVAIVPSRTPAATAPGVVDADDMPAIDVSALPTADELRASGVALPDLQLNLHIYNASPAGRSVLLNGQRVREGDYTPNGVKVERITPDGVVLEAAGRRYRVDAGG